MLCVNWEEGKAWLELNPFVDPCGADMEACEQRCADFGIRTCTDIDDFSLAGMSWTRCGGYRNPLRGRRIRFVMNAATETAVCFS